MNTPYKIQDQELLLSDARGIYIPCDFLDFEILASQLTSDQRESLSDPENEYYWEAWDEVLNQEFTDDKGLKWSLYQDGNLWAIPSHWEWDEDSETYVSPKEN